MASQLVRHYHLPRYLVLQCPNVGGDNYNGSSLSEPVAIISARGASASENITNLLASIAGVKLETIPCPQLAVVRILIMKFVKIML